MVSRGAAQRALRDRTASTSNGRARTTRRRLQEAYQQLVDNPGSDLSVAQVVQLAGVNRTTFYAHFDSLAALRLSLSVPAVPADAVGGPPTTRAEATRSRLRSAALELASRRRIEDVSVADLSRRAGIARATFYNHAADPPALLRETLHDEITAFSTALMSDTRAQRLSNREHFERSVRVFVAHVMRNEEVYRIGLVDEPASPTLLALLSDDLTAWVRTFLDQAVAPTSLPQRLQDRFSVAVLDMYAAQAGHGGVGMLAAWLRTRDPDVDAFIEVSLSVLPSFWFDDERGR